MSNVQCPSVDDIEISSENSTLLGERPMICTDISISQLRNEGGDFYYVLPSRLPDRCILVKESSFDTFMQAQYATADDLANLLGIES